MINEYKHTDSSSKVIDNKIAKQFISNLTPNMISFVYSGRQGCMCGCKGTYKYNPLHIEESSKKRGYDIDADELSLRSVKIILNKLKKLSCTLEHGNIIFYNDPTNGRTLAAYIATEYILKEV